VLALRAMNAVGRTGLALLLAAGLARPADLGSVPASRPPRLLALGDSYTSGQGVDPADRWPVQLAALLSRHGIPFAPPVIVARTGWTTADLLSALDREAPRGPFALVALQIGVNDQYRGERPDAAYRDRFHRLLARAIAAAGGEPGQVLVLSIPDWGASPFAQERGRTATADIATAIDRFNAVNREETARAGARWVDVTEESRAAAGDPAAFAADGLHPSAEQYGAWAHIALDPALAALSRLHMKVGSP
jgi:lysophospholipase L1-like esterase